MMNRRRFLLTSLAAPAVIRTPGLIMPVKAMTPPLAINQIPLIMPASAAALWAIEFYIGHQWGVR
jgi:hypothetical protein